MELGDVFKQLNIPAFARLDQEGEQGGEESDTFEIPEELPILPLRGLVVYPLTAVPIRVGQPRSIKLVDDAVVEKRLIGLVASKDPELQEPGPDDVHRVGTVASVHRLFKAPDETITLIMQGLRRIEIEEFTTEDPYLMAKVHEIPEVVEETVEVKALQRSIVDTFRNLAELLPAVPEELLLMALNVESPLQLAYAIATHIRIGLDDAQKLLELAGTRDKLHLLLALLTKELEVVELGHKIQSEAQSELEKTQREYLLREQLKAIQRELGESSEQQMEVEEFRGKIEAVGMPEEAEKEARR
jgi:ATP-dependent Lon protease